MRMSMSVMFRSSGPCPKGVRGLCLQCLVRCAAVSLFICMWHVSCQGWHECGAKCMVLLCFTSSLTTYTRRSCGNVATHIMLLEYEDFHKFPILSCNPGGPTLSNIAGGVAGSSTAVASLLEPLSQRSNVKKRVLLESDASGVNKRKLIQKAQLNIA